MNNWQKFLFVLALSLVLFSTVSASLPDRNEYFVSQITGEKYLVYKNFSSRTYTFTSGTGQVFTTEKDIIEFEIKKHPEINYKLDKYLQNLVESAKTNETLANKVIPVIIVFEEQPAHKISQSIKAKYKPKFDKITGRSKTVYNRIKPLVEKERRHNKNTSELLKIESELLTEEEKAILDQAGVELEYTINEMRKEILLGSKSQVEKIQAPIIEKIKSRDNFVNGSLVIFNSLFVTIPVGYFRRIIKGTFDRNNLP